MINATKVYVVHPLSGKSAAFMNKQAADHYAHLHRLMFYENMISVYECDTTNFKDMADMYPYYFVGYRTHDDVLRLEPCTENKSDSLCGADGGCIYVPSSHQAIQDLFLKGDEQPLKNLILDKCKGAANENNIS